jgi:adenine deaminase
MLKTWQAACLALTLAFATLSVVAVAAQPKPGRRAAVVVRDIAVLDAAATAWLPHRDIVIWDTTIGEVSPAGSELPDAKVVINGAGKFAIPGLFDSRVRLDRLWPQSAALFLVYGVTSVHDVGVSDPAVLNQWRSDLANGRAFGPRIVALDGATATPQAPLGSGAADAASAGSGLHRELLRLVRDHHVTPSEALRRVTAAPIEPGTKADLIVLDADPLADIRHTQDIDAVIFRGETLTRAHLNQLQSRATPRGPQR